MTRYSNIWGGGGGVTHGNWTSDDFIFMIFSLHGYHIF